MRELDLDPVSRDFYETARLIMEKEETEIFRHLPDAESRREFIHNFWKIRDPDPQTEENEFKAEFERRVAYANRFFIEGIPGWKTDRGRIYIMLGPPDKVEQRPLMQSPTIRGAIWWGYYDDRYSVLFLDRSGHGRYEIDAFNSSRGDNLLQTLSRARRRYIQNPADGFNDRFVDFEVLYERDKKRFKVILPVEDLIFTEEENIWKCEFEFRFHIYKRKGTWQAKFKSYTSFAEPSEQVLKQDSIAYAFPYLLPQGSYYVEVAVAAKQGINRTRKIFKVEVF
jgi:GWxTD domain-containing protein